MSQCVDLTMGKLPGFQIFKSLHFRIGISILCIFTQKQVWLYYPGYREK